MIYLICIFIIIILFLLFYKNKIEKLEIDKDYEKIIKYINKFYVYSPPAMLNVLDYLEIINNKNHKDIRLKILLEINSLYYNILPEKDIDEEIENFNKLIIKYIDKRYKKNELKNN